MMRTSNTRDGNSKDNDIARYKKLIRSPIKISNKINTMNSIGKQIIEKRNMSSKSSKIKYTLSKNTRAKSFSMGKQLSKSNSNKFNNFSKISSKIKSEDYVYQKYRPASKVSNENLSNSTTIKNNYLKKSRYNSADQYKMNYIGKDNNLDKFFQSNKDIIAKSHNFKKEFDLKKNKFNLDKKDYIPLDFYFPPQQINININNYNFSNYNNNNNINNSKVNNSQKFNSNYSKNEMSKPFSNNSELMNSNFNIKSGLRPVTKNEANRNLQKQNVNLDKLYNSNSNSNFSSSLANSYVNSGGQIFNNNNNNKIFFNKNNDSEFNNNIDIKESNEYKEFRNNVVLNNHKFTEIDLIQDIENNREKNRNNNDKIKISKIFQQKIKDINNTKESKSSVNKNIQNYKSNDNHYKFSNNLKFSEKIDRPLIEKQDKPFDNKKIEKFDNREISGYMSSKQEKRPDKKMEKISFKDNKNNSKDVKDVKENKNNIKNSQKNNDHKIHDSNNNNFVDEEESFYNDVYFFMEESDKISGKKMMSKDNKYNKFEMNKESSINKNDCKEVKEIGIGVSGNINSNKNTIKMNEIVNNNNQNRLKTPFEFQGVRQSKIKNVAEKNTNIFKDEILEENVRYFLIFASSTRTKF